MIISPLLIVSIVMAVTSVIAFGLWIIDRAEWYMLCLGFAYVIFAALAGYGAITGAGAI